MIYQFLPEKWAKLNSIARESRRIKKVQMQGLRNLIPEA